MLFKRKFYNCISLLLVISLSSLCTLVRPSSVAAEDQYVPDLYETKATTVVVVSSGESERMVTLQAPNSDCALKESKATTASLQEALSLDLNFPATCVEVTVAVNKVEHPAPQIMVLRLEDDKEIVVRHTMPELAPPPVLGAQKHQDAMVMPNDTLLRPHKQIITIAEVDSKVFETVGFRKHSVTLEYIQVFRC